MKYALVNNVITEAISGKIGICRICHTKVRGYVGDVQVAHWRHLSPSNCDSWFENETKWHRDWKNKFPSIWQEKIIEKNNEKHIADVYNPYKNLIIEFQNSKIDVKTLKIRETFYGKMLWVVNTEPHKKNITIENSIPKKSIDKMIQREESNYHYLIDDYGQKADELLSLVRDYESGKPWKTKYEKFKQSLSIEIRENVANHILLIFDHNYKSTGIEVQKILYQMHEDDGNAKKYQEIREEIKNKFKKYSKLPSDFSFLNWKYQHNHWNFSDKNVFLDLGDENVYWIKDFLKSIKGFIVQTVPKNRFINYYSKTQNSAPSE